MARVMLCMVLTACAPASGAGCDRASPGVQAGLAGPVGAGPNARIVRELRIAKPGVYKNLMVDGQWADRDLVKVLADNVVLRNCTIRYGRRDAVEVYARNVLIENCKIHHVLAGTFRDQEDAHGITGRPSGLTIRNCEIAFVSGDCVQFDPSRKLKPYPWDNVLIERCFLWTAPLTKDRAGFRKGERPGENAFDSKTHPAQDHARVTFRRCLFRGWGHGQIGNGAALNLKEKVQAVVDECVFVENDIAFRCRGTRGSAWVTARNCTIYHTDRVWRLEDRVRNVRIFHLAYGPHIAQRFQKAAGGAGEGFLEAGTRAAPPLARWPYDRLPVGEVVPADQNPQSRDDRLPTKPATGWDAAASGLKYKPTPAAGASLAVELFAGGKPAPQPLQRE